MDKKKIAAVIIFILVGLFMFSFSNSDKSLEEEKKTNNTEKKSETTEKKKEDKEETITDADTKDEVKTEDNVTVVPSSNTNTSTSRRIAYNNEYAVVPVNNKTSNTESVTPEEVKQPEDNTERNTAKVRMQADEIKAIIDDINSEVDFEDEDLKQSPIYEELMALMDRLNAAYEKANSANDNSANMTQDEIDAIANEVDAEMEAIEHEALVLALKSYMYAAEPFKSFETDDEELSAVVTAICSKLNELENTELNDLTNEELEENSEYLSDNIDIAINRIVVIDLSDAIDEGNMKIENITYPSDKVNALVDSLRSLITSAEEMVSNSSNYEIDELSNKATEIRSIIDEIDLEQAKNHLNSLLVERDSNNYTTTSFNNYKSVIDNLGDIDSMTKETVDTAINNVNNAISGLVELQVIGISLSSNGYEYELNEDMEEVTVTLVYNDETRNKDITSEVTITGEFDSSVVTDEVRTITYTYGEYSKTYTYTVVDSNLE